MKDRINQLKNEFKEKILSINSEEELKNLIDDFLGKKGKLSEILKQLKDLTPEEKKEVGMQANELKNFLKEEENKKILEIEKANYSKIEKDEKIDVTLGFDSNNKGHLNPLSITTKLLEDIFISLGFKIEDGPQVEIEEYNFDKLNIPDNHPARDVWDTFWITDEINNKRKPGDKYLLRTHTSPVQIRTMLKNEGSVKIIVPGRVFRYEQEDAHHISNFYQLEGLVIGKGITFGDLKWTLNTAMKSLLGEKIDLRFRPSIFPFTEPSVEIDVSSPKGRVELLGAGMVHPKVLEYCSIDPEEYSGFAFGMGIDRIAAQRFGISDVRLVYQTKLKFLEQF